MPRESRRKSSSGIYHIMLRGINRQVIFEDDEDRLRLLQTLKKYKAISQYQLYGYCLMDNHIHLLINENEEALSNIIKRISASYVYWYNNKYERNGHLFQERFKSEVVENHPYFVTVLRYIHQNPVKAGLADHVSACEWTSYQTYIRDANMVDIDDVLNLFSPDRSKAISLYKEHMNEQNDDQCLDDWVKLRVSDSEVNIFLRQWGIANSSSLQQMDKGRRNAIIKDLKKIKGVSVRQLSRVTGISKSVIGRVR